MQNVLNDTKTSFTKLVLTVSEYNKCKTDKNEISLNGKMYDVKIAKITNDQIELDAIYDDVDDEINIKIVKTFSSKTSKSFLPHADIPLFSFDCIIMDKFSINSIFCTPFLYPIFLNWRYSIPLETDDPPPNA